MMGTKGVRFQVSGNRGQKTDVRRQMSEVRGQKIEVGSGTRCRPMKQDYVAASMRKSESECGKVRRCAVEKVGAVFNRD